MDLIARKAAARETLRAARRERDGPGRRAVGEALAVASAGLTGPIAAYASFGTEPPTGPLRRALAARGVRVLLPVVLGTDLGWADDEGVEPGGERGLPEPTGPVVGLGAAGLLEAGVTVVLVPALAVDRRGVRIGKGGGFYDRVLGALPRAPGGPRRLVVVHSEEVLDELPAGPHDLAATVDAALTPDGLVPLCAT